MHECKICFTEFRTETELIYHFEKAHENGNVPIPAPVKISAVDLPSKEQLSTMKVKMVNDRVYRNNLDRCPLCDSNVKDLKRALYKELINTLYEVYKWCGQHRRHEFEMKDVKHLISKTNYTRFGNLHRFGGIVYRPKDPKTEQTKKGLFGINMKRAKAFFNGEYEIPVQIILNPITDEIIDAKYVKISEFPGLVNLLDEHGLYDYERDLIS